MSGNGKNLLVFQAFWAEIGSWASRRNSVSGSSRYSSWICFHIVAARIRGLGEFARLGRPLVGALNPRLSPKILCGETRLSRNTTFVSALTCAVGPLPLIASDVFCAMPAQGLHRRGGRYSCEIGVRPITPVEIDGATQVWKLSPRYAQFRAPAFPSNGPCSIKMSRTRRLGSRSDI